MLLHPATLVHTIRLGRAIVAEEGVIEIVRVLHEKMDPSRHLDEPPTDTDF